MIHAPLGWHSPLILIFLLPFTVAAQSEWYDLLLHARKMERAGKYRASAAELEQALKLAKSARKDTPELAVTYNNLGSAYDALGRTLEAEQLFKSSVRIWEKLGGRSCIELTPPLDNLAGLYRRARQWSKARDLYTRSIEIRGRVHNPDDPDMAILYNNLAQLEMDAGNSEEADRLMGKALAIWDREPDTYAAERAAVLGNRAFLMIGVGRYSEAGGLAARSIAITEQRLGKQHPALVSPLIALAEVDRNRNKYEAADAELMRALAICKSKFSSNARSRAIVLSGLAKLRNSEGQRKQAKHFERESRRITSAYRQANHADYTIDIGELLATRAK